MGNCVSCGKELYGKYCAFCGERVLDPEQRSLKFLVSMFAEEVTSVNGKLWLTLKNFFTNPGQQCLDFHLGIRKKYLSFFTLFFLFNIAYFFFSRLSDFNLSLEEQLSQFYAPLIEPTIKSYLTLEGTSLEELNNRYSQISELVAKSIIFISVPFLALLIWPLNSKRGYYLQDHVIFSLNIYCFVMIFPIILQAVFIFFEWLLGDLMGNYFKFYVQTLFAEFIIFLWASHKKTYRTRNWHTAILLVPMLFAFFVSHMAYRFVQFWVTWLQLA